MKGPNLKGTGVAPFVAGVGCTALVWWLAASTPIDRHSKACVAQEVTFAVQNLPSEFERLDDDAVFRIIDRCEQIQQEIADEVRSYD